MCPTLLPAEWRAKLGVLADDETGEHPGCITLPKLATAAKRQKAATTLQNGKINISGFPEHFHTALKPFDLERSDRLFFISVRPSASPAC